MVRETLERWMQERQDDLIANYESKGLKASGAFGRAVRHETSETQATMYAPSYVGVMVNGRRPNKNQLPEALRAWVGWAGSTFLRDWVRDKGIDLNPYAVAWKLAREGVQVPNAHNDGRLLEDAFTPSRYEELFSSISKSYVIKLTSDIKETWQ
jgi:hypothetical protein